MQFSLPCQYPALYAQFKMAFEEADCVYEQALFHTNPAVEHSSMQVAETKALAAIAVLEAHFAFKLPDSGLLPLVCKARRFLWAVVIRKTALSQLLAAPVGVSEIMRLAADAAVVFDKDADLDQTRFLQAPRVHQTLCYPPSHAGLFYPASCAGMDGPTLSPPLPEDPDVPCRDAGDQELPADDWEIDISEMGGYGLPAPLELVQIEGRSYHLG
jgi:hypothetical protein